jgi:competence protein ComEA
MMAVRKPNFSLLGLVTLLFVVFTAGFFLVTTQRKAQLTVSVSKEIQQIPQEITPNNSLSQDQPSVHFPVSINNADMDQLTALPGIGEVLARRIIAYRETNGKFTSVEELLNVEGIGQKRLEEIMDLILIGG